MQEHWTLVVERASEASLENFLAGKCKTVSQRDAIWRLINACGEKIPKEASDQFEKIATHRNRMIHFFHEAVSKEADHELVQEIAKEQCRGWFYLKRLLDEWVDQFSKYQINILIVAKQIEKNREYLSVAFEKLKPQIEADKKAGTKFQHCSGCGYAAAAIFDWSEVLFEKECRVCGLRETYLEFPCPKECGATLFIEADDGSDRTCPTCKYEVTARDLADILDTEGRDPTDFYTPVNCAQCSARDSVVKHHENYICTECLGITDEVHSCGWCGEGQVGGGNLDGSYNTGCEFCDGHGYGADDD